MAKTPLSSALHKLDFAVTFRLKPCAISHLLRREAVPRLAFLRQVHERAFRSLQIHQLVVDSFPQWTGESCGDALDIMQLVILATILPDYQRGERRSRSDVTADDEFSF